MGAYIVKSFEVKIQDDSLLCQSYYPKDTQGRLSLFDLFGPMRSKTNFYCYP